MKITSKQIKERLAAPTTPFWESVSRRAVRLKKAMLGLASSMILANVSFPSMPYMDIITKAGGIIGLIGTAIGWAVEFTANMTVADPTELVHEPKPAEPEA